MFRSTIQNQEVEVYFNVNTDYLSECYIDQYCVKVDLSDKSYDDYDLLKQDLIDLFSDNMAICIHGFQEQQVIFAFKATSEFFIFKYEHLEEAIMRVVNHVKEMCVEVEVPYVIEIGIMNLEKDEEDEDEDDEY